MKRSDLLPNAAISRAAERSAHVAAPLRSQRSGFALLAVLTIALVMSGLLAGLEGTLRRSLVQLRMASDDSQLQLIVASIKRAAADRPPLPAEVELPGFGIGHFQAGVIELQDQHGTVRASAELPQDVSIAATADGRDPDDIHSRPGASDITRSESVAGVSRNFEETTR